jgi:hypothetical protein
MNDPGRIVTLNRTEVERLRLEYIQTRETVGLRAAALWAFLQMSRKEPERIDELISRGESIFEAIDRELVGFHKVLNAALEAKAGEPPAQQSAPPNGGPAKSFGNPGTGGGPPSVN